MSWWLELGNDEKFGLDNLPYGVFERDGRVGVGVRVSNHVLDLAALAEAAGVATDAWAQPSLNAHLDQGPDAWAAGRAFVTEQLRDPARADAVSSAFYPLDAVTLRLPFAVADYVDFYASEYHASNIGQMFRPDSEPLTPNWKHLPIGYHGRSGTVVVTGTDIVRPSGQRKAPTDAAPSFGPCRRLDIEAELGFVVGGGTALAEPVPLDRAWSHIFGVVVLNDWSARDIQAWEYVPLGPFLGKSFATSIGAWVTPMAALEAARVPLPGQDPQPLPYLAGDAAYGLDVRYEVELNGTVVTRPEYRDMYWSPAQMLTHLSVNGASIRSGDLFGSGTISGPERSSVGSFMELSWGGKEPFELADGSSHAFLEDGDTVTLRATATGPGGTVIGLGECTGRITPAG